MQHCSAITVPLYAVATGDTRFIVSSYFTAVFFKPFCARSNTCLHCQVVTSAVITHIFTVYLHNCVQHFTFIVIYWFPVCSGSFIQQSLQIPLDLEEQTLYVSSMLYIYTAYNIVCLIYTTLYDHKCYMSSRFYCILVQICEKGSRA